ncbi:MAG: ribonuclease P protein component [Spongiibacteraceae bacterium]|nr:ribonuclease P protein component [Spongiibacteraceae bacterium]
MSASADLRFSKARRLLTAHDYKSVFDDAVLKVSCSQLLILARPNGLEGARLGMVVAKRHIRLATRRNRLKRIVRESFRHAQARLACIDGIDGGIDSVVLARAGADALDKRQLREHLDQLWSQLARKAQRRFATGQPC